jgi:hypothetical protein
MPQDQEKPRFIPVWAEDKLFPQGSVTVVVKRSNHHRARYSYEIVFAGRERPSRFCYVRTSGEGTGRIEIEVAAHSIESAVIDAENYIRDMYQAQEDEAIDRKAAKERANADRDKPVQKPGLKALSKRDAQAREVKS